MSEIMNNFKFHLESVLISNAIKDGLILIMFLIRKVIKEQFNHESNISRVF